MSCDRGFGEIEKKYKVEDYINTPDEYKDMISKLKNAKINLLQPHKVLDLKVLTDEKNKCFTHNRAETTLFSKCRQVYLDRQFPQYMTLQFYNQATGKFDAAENVPLVDINWPIYKLKSPEDFQRHYLSVMGGHTTEEVEMLMQPHLDDERYEMLLPKKLKPGIVYKLPAKKVEHIASLAKYLSPAGMDWINELVKRQETKGKTKKKKPAKIKDPKAPYDAHNKEDELHGFTMNTHKAKKVVPPKGNRGRKKKMVAQGAENQKKDTKVLAKNAKNRKQQVKNLSTGKTPAEQESNSPQKMGRQGNEVKSKKGLRNTGKISSNLTAESKNSTNKGPKLTMDETSKRHKTLSEEEILQTLEICDEKEEIKSANTKNTSSKSRGVGLSRKIKKEKKD